MKVRNINPMGRVLCPDIRRAPIGKGEVIEVDDELGQNLISQEGNWEEVKEPRRGRLDPLPSQAVDSDEPTPQP